MANKDTFLVPVPPQQLGQLQGLNVLPAHLAYRVGRGPHLFRSGGGVPPQGGVMVLDCSGFDGFGPPEPFCQEVVRECLARGFSGAVLDFEVRLPPLEQMAARLDDSFARRGWTLYVPEGYGACAPHARVMIPSALSGGSLSLRLEEAGERFGRRRVALALEKTAEDFFLPSPSGGGTPLTQEELTALLDRLRPSVFYSRELCARYFTYMSRETGAHFVLFDDGDTLARKVETARAAGVDVFLIPWEHARAHARELGLSRPGLSRPAR